MKEKNFNEMTCSHCNTKGLQQINKPKLKQYSFRGKLTEVELIEYICPNCRQHYIKYNYICYGLESGTGLIEKESFHLD